MSQPDEPDTPPDSLLQELAVLRERAILHRAIGEQLARRAEELEKEIAQLKLGKP